MTISDIERREMELEIFALPKPKKIIIPPTDEEVFRMLKIAKEGYGIHYGHKKWDLKFRMRMGRIMQLRILIFLVTFCRVSEACLMRRKDFNLEDGFVEIYWAYAPKKKLKGMPTPEAPPASPIKRPKRGSTRVQALGKDVCYILDRLFKEIRLRQDDFILSGSNKYVRPRNIQHFHKVIAKASGVDPEKVYPHIFRSKGATMLKKYGYALAAQVLGHKDSGETIRHSYERPYEEDRLNATREVTDNLVSQLKADLDKANAPEGGEDGANTDTAASIP